MVIVSMMQLMTRNIPIEYLDNQKEFVNYLDKKPRENLGYKIIQY